MADRRGLFSGLVRSSTWVVQSWAFAAFAMAAAPQSFQLADHGTLTLPIPAGWSGELKPSANALPPTIRVTATAGEVVITPVWPIAPANLKLDEAALRAKVAEAAKQTEPHSTEGALALHDLKTPGGRGFYYAATDRAPKPGEYKYLTQGMIPVGAIALAFTVVSNDQDGKTARAALDMLKSAALRRVPN
jgi:hypothetical protein